MFKNQSDKPYYALCIVILFLLVVIGIQQVQLNKDPEPFSVTTIDTVWVTKHDTVEHTNIKLVKEESQPVPEELKPDTNYATLRAQYGKMLMDFIPKRTYTDTLIMDDSSWAIVSPTIQMNRLLNINYQYLIKYPEVHTTTTNTVKQKKHAQVYADFGAAFSTNFKKFSLSSDLIPHAGFTFRPRNGKWMLTGQYGSNFSGNQTADVTFHQLISFRSK